MNFVSTYTNPHLQELKQTVHVVTVRCVQSEFHLQLRIHDGEDKGSNDTVTRVWLSLSAVYLGRQAAEYFSINAEFLVLATEERCYPNDRSEVLRLKQK